MEYVIRKIGNGWYDFKGIPQDDRYIKIHALNCLEDKKAVKVAQRNFGKENIYTIEEC